jgi:hypothetical protein
LWSSTRIHGWQARCRRTLRLRGNYRPKVRHVTRQWMDTHYVHRVARAYYAFFVGRPATGERGLLSDARFAEGRGLPCVGISLCCGGEHVVEIRASRSGPYPPRAFWRSDVEVGFGFELRRQLENGPIWLAYCRGVVRYSQSTLVAVGPWRTHRPLHTWRQRFVISSLRRRKLTERMIWIGDRQGAQPPPIYIRSRGWHLDYRSRWQPDGCFVHDYGGFSNTRTGLDYRSRWQPEGCLVHDDTR